MKLFQNVLIIFWICFCAINLGFILAGDKTPVTVKDLESVAVRIAEYATIYDVIMEHINTYSNLDIRPVNDSTDFAHRYAFVSYDSMFIAPSRSFTRYKTYSYGFEEFEITTYSRGYFGSEYSYNVAVGYDGGFYRLKGFKKCDLQNLIKHVFKKVETEKEAKLIAKWYFGFQDISFAFHEKVIPEELNKSIIKYIKPLIVKNSTQNFILIDYATTFYMTPVSSNSEEKRYDVSVHINKYSIIIDKNNCNINAKEERVKTVNLKNVSPEEFQITYLY
jgi:hypothetical protein